MLAECLLFFYYLAYSPLSSNQFTPGAPHAAVSGQFGMVDVASHMHVMLLPVSVFSVQTVLILFLTVCRSIRLWSRSGFYGKVCRLRFSQLGEYLECRESVSSDLR